MKQVYIFQIEIIYHGGVGQFQVVSANYLEEALEKMQQHGRLPSWAQYKEIDFENDDENYWFIENPDNDEERLGITLVDVL